MGNLHIGAKTSTFFFFLANYSKNQVLDGQRPYISFSSMLFTGNIDRVTSEYANWWLKVFLPWLT